MNMKEIKIPVPWGFIAAKTWGNEKNPIVLAVHGWIDNANSFDTLIPLLPDSYYYVCIDLPSHGKSSHLEISLLAHQIDFVLIIRFVCDYLREHFKRNKVIIMGHSFGGFICIHFAQLYPEFVEKLISFDIIYYYPYSPTAFTKKLKEEYFQDRYAILKKGKRKPPTYTKEEAVNRISLGRLTPITKESATILAERNLELAEDGKYKFTLALHLKQMVTPGFTLAGIIEIAQNFPINCPHLLIFAEDSIFMSILYKRVLDEYKKNERCEIHIVPGNHEVHLENPERVGPIVTQFLLKYSNKL